MGFDMGKHKETKAVWVAMDPGPECADLEARLSRLGFIVSCHPCFPEDDSTLAISDYPQIVVADLALQGRRSSLERAAILWQQGAVPTLFLAGLEDLGKLVPRRNPHFFRILPDTCSDVELQLNLDLAVQAARLEKENRKKQAGLEKEVAWLRLLVEGTREGIVIVDQHGRVRDANHAFAQKLGYTMEEISDLNVWDWDAKFPKSHILERINATPVAGEVFKTICCRKDGSLFDAEVSTNVGIWEGSRVVFCLCRDITDQVRAQKELQESQARLAALSDASFESIFLSDQGICLDQNLTAQRMFGYTRDEAVGRYGMEWILPSDRDLVKNNILSGYEKPYEVTALRKDGTTFPAEIQGRMFNAFGRRIRITALRDISDRKQIQAEKMNALAEVAEARKLALVGQVAGKMAHDFNNILGIIMGNVGLSLMDCRDPGVKDTLELVLEQTQRGKNLTRNLVAFARDQEPRQEFFPVNQKVELVLKLLQKDLEGIHLILDLSSAGPDLFADPGMIEHALVNILQNAIHAVSLSERPVILIRTGYQDGYIIIEIEDNGCGIPDAYLDRIFEPSFTLKGTRDKAKVYKGGIKGTGYGMANVKKYLSQHQGRIDVSSKVREGTRVEISLPVIEKKLTPEEIRQVATDGVCTGRYILLVEDEPAISDVQYRILTQAPCSHRVDVADTGKKAMALIEQNAYDIISLDYMLPGGISGMDIYRHIRKKDTSTPVVFISGNIEFLESIKDLTQKDLCIDHLSKPCRNIEYIQCIDRLLNRCQRK